MGGYGGGGALGTVAGGRGGREGWRDCPQIEDALVNVLKEQRL